MEPIVYFRNRSGHLTLAPYSAYPTPPDCDREYADTLTKARELEKRLVEQERQTWEREGRVYQDQIEAHSQIIRDKLYTRMIGSEACQYEKDFIRAWLDLRDEQKKKKYAVFYGQWKEHHLWALNNDSPGRRVDEERFDSDKITVKR